MTCIVCAVEIAKHPRITYKQFQQQKFCSVQCKAKWQSENLRGKNSYVYKHGLSTERELLHGSANYRHWRKQIFQRDDYTCQSCGKHGGYLEAHHIKPVALFPELALDLTNGQALCGDCHSLTDSFRNNKLITNAIQ